MTCLNPRLAYKKTNGQYTLAKIADTAAIERSTLVPCGQCMQCRISHQRQWATRMVHEAKMHQDSCFVTLTIDDDHRNESHSLDQRDMQLFIKKLRKKLSPQKIRIFWAGEYGEDTLREHYHAIIFGYFPTDKELFRKNKYGDQLYTSKLLSDTWAKGFVTIGEFNSTTADYCAKYVTKAYIGKDKENAYNWTDIDGVVHKRLPPLQRASNRPGLGAAFYEKYKSDMYPHDSCIVDGKKRPVPKAYDRKYRKEHPEEFLALKARRNDKFTTVLNNDPHQKTKSFRNAKKVILEQQLYVNKRNQT
jgi:hypothetical protein